ATTTRSPSAADQSLSQSVAKPRRSSSSGLSSERSISKYLTLPPKPTHPKRLALEEKERKKTEREEKKRQREEEQKRKAEERQRKAETKANKVKEAAEKRKEKAKGAGKRKVSNEATDIPMPPKKRVCKLSQMESDDPEINTDMCCVCSILYSEDRTGKEWIECACGRWLHEECGEDCILDSNGRERFCPICL
ncbi:hypothetical protein GBAR_LOCUS9922, partial [Geodia barretti]